MAPACPPGALAACSRPRERSAHVHPLRLSTRPRDQLTCGGDSPATPSDPAPDHEISSLVVAILLPPPPTQHQTTSSAHLWWRFSGAPSDSAVLQRQTGWQENCVTMSRVRWGWRARAGLPAACSGAVGVTCLHSTWRRAAQTTKEWKETCLLRHAGRHRSLPLRPELLTKHRQR